MKTTLCTQTFKPIPQLFGQNQARGRVEAAVAFYLATPRSGNSSIYYLKLPYFKPNKAGAA
jgi:hypothetical protein